MCYNDIHKGGVKMDFDYLKQKRILLVDDEQELLDMVSSIFANEGFCNVKTAKTVKEALCIAETFQPELAILDVMLPDGNGFDLMKQLKNKSDYPVLFLTARGEDDDKFRGFGLGADDYIVKPFLPKELIYRVNAILRRSYKGESPNVKLAGSEIDFDRAEVIKMENILHSQQKNTIYLQHCTETQGALLHLMLYAKLLGVTIRMDMKTL